MKWLLCFDGTETVRLHAKLILCMMPRVRSCIHGKVVWLYGSTGAWHSVSIIKSSKFSENRPFHSVIPCCTLSNCRPIFSFKPLELRILCPELLMLMSTSTVQDLAMINDPPAHVLLWTTMVCCTQEKNVAS